MEQLIINAIGSDRPGLVGQLTGRLHEAGANVLDSRMVNLRGQFAMILLIEGKGEVLTRIRDGLEAWGRGAGLRVWATEQHAGAEPAQGLPFRLKTYSMDQPGILHRVTDLLRQHGVNIEDLEARQESAPFVGSPLFVMEMRLTVPTNVSLQKLRRELGELGDTINCDVDLEPA